MGIYYALIVFAFILSYKEISSTDEGSVRISRIFGFLIFASFFFISALRSYYVGSDTIMYVQRALSDSKNLSLREIYAEGRWEIGFAALCKFCLLFESPGRALIVVSSLLTFSIMGIATFRLSPRPATSGLLLILGSIFFLDLQLMRQAIAMAIVLYACQYLKRKTIYAYVLLVFAAALFHKSALIMLLLPAIEYIISRKHKLLTQMSIIVVAVLIVVVPASLYIQLSGLTGYSGYTDSSSYWQSGNKTPVLYVLCFASWLIAFVEVKRGTDELSIDEVSSKAEINYDNLIYATLILGLLLCILSFRVSILVRLVPYCFTIISVLIPSYNKSIIKSDASVKTLSLLYFPFIMLFVFTVYIVPDWLAVFDYQLMDVTSDYSLLTV